MKKTVKRNRQRGKEHQKAIKNILQKYGDTLNIGTLGLADLLVEIGENKYVVECKSRSRFVANNWIEQAESYISAMKIYDRIPIVIIHSKNKRFSDDLVVIKLSDFISINRRM